MVNSALLLLSAAASVVSATPIEARQSQQQSKPFNLVLQSSNKTLNGAKLGACHEGAAIESLCVGGGVTFRHNTTASQQFDPNFGKTGILTYVLQGSNFNESEGMSFYYDPSTNVALPLLEPTDTFTYVGFDKQNKMNVQTYLNDEVSPPTDTKLRALYRWYVCTTNYAAYTYSTLTWVLGNGKPQNPSCQKVDVIRKFL